MACLMSHCYVLNCFILNLCVVRLKIFGMSQLPLYTTSRTIAYKVQTVQQDWSAFLWVCQHYGEKLCLSWKESKVNADAPSVTEGIFIVSFCFETLQTLFLGLSKITPKWKIGVLKNTRESIFLTLVFLTNFVLLCSFSSFSSCSSSSSSSSSKSLDRQYHWYYLGRNISFLNKKN